MNRKKMYRVAAQQLDVARWRMAKEISNSDGR